MPRTTLYCFYLSTERMDETIIASPIKTFGCSLMSAYDVKGLRAGKVRHVSKVQKYMITWHELVCHPARTSLLDHIKSVTKKKFVNHAKALPNDRTEITEPPDYVLRVLRATGNNLYIDEAPLALAGIMVVAEGDAQRR